MAKMKDGILKRGNRWYYVIRVTDPATGQSKPKWVGGFDSEDEAKKERDEARVKARRGEYVDRNRITVAAYLEQWLDGHAVTIKPRTLAGYRDMIKRYVVPRIGGTRLQAVRPDLVSKLYRDLLAGGGKNGRALSYRSVDQVHRILRKAFNDAVRIDQVLATNPVERAKRPRKPALPPGTIWDVGQLRAFLGHARKHRLFAFFHLAAYTGARRGELLHLRWSDIEIEYRGLPDGTREPTAGKVTINGSTAVIEGVRVEGTPKNGHRRVVSIDAGTVRVLEGHRNRQSTDRKAAGEKWTETSYVFTTARGKPLYPDTVSQLMPKLIAAYNDPKNETEKPAEALPAARVHDLRHIHATLLLLAGVPVHVVAARLGHTDPAVTLRVYAHVIKEVAAEVAEIFAKAVEAGEPDREDPPGQELAA